MTANSREDFVYTLHVQKCQSSWRQCPCHANANQVCTVKVCILAGEPGGFHASLLRSARAGSLLPLRRRRHHPQKGVPPHPLRRALHRLPRRAPPHPPKRVPHHPPRRAPHHLLRRSVRCPCMPLECGRCHLFLSCAICTLVSCRWPEALSAGCSNAAVSHMCAFAGPPPPKKSPPPPKPASEPRSCSSTPPVHFQV